MSAARCAVADIESHALGVHPDHKDEAIQHILGLESQLQTGSVEALDGLRTMGTASITAVNTAGQESVSGIASSECDGSQVTPNQPSRHGSVIML